MKANTVILTAADGVVQELPLDLLIERGAVLATKVNGQDLMASMGAVNQLWIPGLPAKYFVRDIVSVEFEERDTPPSLEDFLDNGEEYTNRPNVSIKAPYSCALGESFQMEGYADDFDRAIVAVKLSFDGGTTWLDHETPGASIGRWVYWRYEWQPPHPGRFQVMAKAVNDRGEVSPIAAVHVFEVFER